MYCILHYLGEMEDIDKEETTSIRGIDWELLSLTASAYAAAPGPKPFDAPVESKAELNKDEQVASAAMFMSDYFIFPPDEHKTLLVEPDCNEIQKELQSPDTYLAEEHSGAIKYDEDYPKLKSDDALIGIQLLDHGRNLSDHSMEFGEGKELEDLTMVGQKQDIYDDPSLSTFVAKTEIRQYVLFNENSGSAEPYDPSLHNPGYLSDYSNDSRPTEENKLDESAHPCEGWWKRHAMSLYNHAKEANTFWSVFVAAAVMGFVILGQRWQKERRQLQQLKWLTIGDESLSQPLGPISRLKDILVGGRQRTFVIHGQATSNHLGV